MSEDGGVGRDELESVIDRITRLARGEPLRAAEADRHRFLARASVVLDETLDPDVTLARVATLAVEGIADWVSVDMVDADGSLRHVVSAHADPAQTELIQALRERYPPEADDLIGAPNVVRTGRSELYREVTEEMLQRAAKNDEQLRLALSVGVRSAMVVP